MLYVGSWTNATVHALIKVDHGWWGAQLYEPYVSPKVTFAVRYHQALRFYPDTEAGYVYGERMGIGNGLGMPTHPGSPAWLVAVGESMGEKR